MPRETASPPGERGHLAGISAESGTLDACPMMITRRVNREAVVVLGWGRAILLQLAHPLVAAGVGAHSDFDGGPLAYVGRMRRTIGAMLSLTFGTESEIRETAGRINAIHHRVHGKLDCAVGGYAARHAVRRHGRRRYSPGSTPPSSTASFEPTPCSSDRWRRLTKTATAPRRHRSARCSGFRRTRCPTRRTGSTAIWIGCNRTIGSRSARARDGSLRPCSRRRGDDGSPRRCGSAA